MSDQRYYTRSEWNALPRETKMQVERDTLFHHLDVAGVTAAEHLLEALHAGKVDGSCYWNDATGCGCVIGTLAVAAEQTTTPGNLTESELRDLGYRAESVPTVEPYFSCLKRFDAVEELAFNVGLGDTPENNEAAAQIAKWVGEWLNTREAQ